MAVTSGAGAAERVRAPFAVKVIATVALIFLLESAREIVLPVAIAIILTFLLAPLVRLLRHRGLNDAAAAAVVVFGLLFVLGLLGSRLVAPASAWIARAPTSVQQLIDAYETLRKSVPFLAPPQIALRPVVTGEGACRSGDHSRRRGTQRSRPSQGQDRDRRDRVDRVVDQAGGMGHRFDCRNDHLACSSCSLRSGG